MTVTLESRIRQMQVFNLAHASFCKEACACTDLVVTRVHEDPRTGQRSRRAIPRMAPVSLTLLARERKGGLPEAILGVPEIAAAIARGHVRVVEQTPDRPSQPAALASGVAPEAATGQRPGEPAPAAAVPPKTLASEPARKEA